MNCKDFIMKRIIPILYLVIAVGIIVYYAFVAPEVNVRHISKGVTLIVLYLIYAIKNIKVHGLGGYKDVAERFQGILIGVFDDNKTTYNRLMKAMSLYENERYKKANRILDKLENKCKRNCEYVAVYYMKAICYKERGLLANAIAEYQNLLKYNMNHSVAWSNLGLLYQACNDMDNAYEAYCNSIRSNSMNYNAYNNLAMYYIDVGNWKEAEYNALKALEIVPDMYQAMEKLTIVYRMTGDMEQFEKYRKLYVMNGGNIKQLDEYINSI